MKCKNCGNELGDVKYCPNCGAPVLVFEEDIYENQQRFQETYTQMHKQNNHKNGVSTLGVLAVIFCFTWILGFVGIILAIIDLSKKDGKNKVPSKIAIAFFVIYTFLMIRSCTRKDSDNTNIEQVEQNIDEIIVEDNDVILTDDIAEEIIEDTYGTSVEEQSQIPLYIVTVDQLYDELETNALKASTTYKDQYIEITGKLSNIDAQGDYFNLSPLNDEWSFDSVQCYIDKEYLDQVINFTMDSEIVVRGEITQVGEVLGYSLEVDLIITEFEERDETFDNVVIEGDNTVIMIDVTTLFEDLDDNALYASKIYKGKYVELTGQLSNIDAQGHYFSLEEVGNNFSWDNVTCYIDSRHLEKVMEFTDGSVIVVRGTITEIGELLGYSLEVDEIISY